MTKTLFDDDTLKKAIKISCEQELKDLDDEMGHAEPHVFSGKFLEKMQVLRKGRQEKKPSMPGHKKFPLRYAMVAALLFMLSTATVLASEQIRNLLYNVYVTLFSDYAVVENKDGMSEDSRIEFVPYEPYYIPYGYKKSYDDIDTTVRRRDTTYENESDVLVFSQNVTGTTGSTITSDGSVMEELLIQGVKAVFVTDGKYGSIIFEMEGYTFYITGLLEREEMVKVADSVSPSE